MLWNGVALLACVQSLAEGSLIKVHGRPAITTDGGVHSFAANLSMAMLARERPKDHRKGVRETLRRHGFPNAGEREFGTAVAAYENLRVGLWSALAESRFLDAHRRAEEPMLWLDFGVYRGTSINISAVFRDELGLKLGLKLGHAPKARVVGFDTFDGLPQKWKKDRGGYRKGSFSWHKDYPDRGPEPPTRPGVAFEVGLFEDTLGPFLARNAGLVAYANIDSDLYEGAKQVLDAVGPRLFPGTRLHFHELGSARPARRAWIASQEARALFAWLSEHPCANLRLANLAGEPEHESAVFVVEHGPACS